MLYEVRNKTSTSFLLLIPIKICQLKITKHYRVAIKICFVIMPYSVLRGLCTFFLHICNVLECIHSLWSPK
jgi:hypothetical protein